MKSTFIEQLKGCDFSAVLDASISKHQFAKLDLSIDNPDLKRIDVTSSKKIGDYINKVKKEQDAIVAYGGYLEKRDIYNRSAHFCSRDLAPERNIHLGIDLWLEEGAPLFAPIDGEVHSFKNNKNFGDYGPTIILEHKLGGHVFYTLYGHLSLSSIEHVKSKQKVYKGNPIGYLGDSTVNGDYAPHLHFQVIIDLQGFWGDYPGVCSTVDLGFYKNNCPNPEVILKL